MNAAIQLLLRFHAASRWRRVKRSFSSRRRLLLTLAAIGLGVLWLGQTIASILLREPYAPESFHRYASMFLTTYFLWHIVRVAYKRPDDAVEWSGAEREQIVGGPFTRREVLTYRFLIILTSTLPKALLLGLVLFPDLWWTGLPGLVLALGFLECFRLAIDLAANCLSKRAYLLARTTVFCGIIVGVCVLFSGSFGAPANEPATTLKATQLVSESISVAEVIRESVFFTFCERPFVLFADVIAAHSFSAKLCGSALAAVLMVAGMLWSVVVLDRRHEEIVAARQLQQFQIGRQRGDKDTAATDGIARLPWVPGWGTMGPLAWRQLKSAGRYRGSLLVALAIPAVLSCAPLFSIPDPTSAFLAVVAAVVFYSFVLLPEAIKFDFRLDCDHLAKLKTLPIAPIRIVIGQLMTPVLIATAFQTSIFLFAGFARQVPTSLIVGAIVLTLPMNAFFVALDNLVFLLYPHRPTQEGFEAFLRTVLKFTFKSLLLGVSAALLTVWAVSARMAVDSMGTPASVQLVFVAGVSTMALLAAGMTLLLVAHTFDRFDVSVSVPA